MSFAIVTMAGRQYRQEDVPGRPTKFSGYYEWMFVPVMTEADFRRLAHEVGEAAGPGSVMHSLEAGEILVRKRIDLTNDNELVIAVGKVVQSFHDAVNPQ